MGELVLGRVGKAVGLGGELVLRATPDLWEEALASSQLVLVGSSGRRRVRIESHRSRGPGAWVVRFGDVTDRTAAQGLVGMELVLEGELDVALPDTLRPFQVRGLRVVLQDGTPVGVVADLVAMPAYDMLVVQDGGRERWIPAVEPILREIDLESGEVRIDPPAGLLEL